MNSPFGAERPDDVTVLCVGAAVHDYVFTVETFPRTDGKYFAAGYTEAGGGPAATGAVAVSRLGGRAVLIARIGSDRVGDRIIGDLTCEGVDTGGVLRRDGQSTVSAVLVDSQGQRMIVNHRDPTLSREVGDLPFQLVDGSSAVLADLRWPEASAAIFEQAASRNVPRVLDADTTDDEAADRPLALASHIVFSRPGLTGLTGADDVVRGLREAQNRFRVFVAVTDGENGCTWLDNGHPRTMPAFKVDTLDTTGAGDVFHGAFALALARGQGEAEGLRYASAAAALKCTKKGGRDGIPTENELVEFIGKNAK